MLPPPKIWHRMVPTLALAHQLRQRVINLGGAGLVVAAAYRPAGGEGYRFRCWQGTGRSDAGAYTWASRPAALTLAPPDETNLEDLSAVADGRGPEARPGAVS